MTNTIFTRIIVADTTKKAWDILEKEFCGIDKVCSIKLQYQRIEFEMLKIKDSKAIRQYYVTIEETINQMQIHGESVNNKKVVDKLLIAIIENMIS